MSYSTILAAIKTLLDAITGIGTTHDYFRLEVDQTQIESLFVSSGKLHTWMITRSAVPSDPYGNKQVLRKHQFDIWGYYAVDDDNASEKTFQVLIDNIQAKFDDIDNIELVAGTNMVQPSQVLEITHVTWCKTLCHRAQIRIVAEEEISVA